MLVIAFCEYLSSAATLPYNCSSLGSKQNGAKLFVESSFVIICIMM